MRILRGLGGRGLACGCLIGVYETYDSQTVAVIDAKGSKCANEAHRVDSTIDHQVINSADRAQPPSTNPTVSR